jgi:hypothetical protein
MSHIELTTKTSDLHSRARDQLTDGPSPTVPAKTAKSRLLGTKRSPRPQQASRSTTRSRSARVGNKQDVVIQMLQRQSGASIEDVIAKTGWQPHSVRGFLSGVVRKKLKLSLVSEVGKDGIRRYHVASKPPKR